MVDLDPVNFSDQVFASYASIKPNEPSDAAAGSRQKTRNAEVLTDDLFYQDEETNTKFKRAEI